MPQAGSATRGWGRVLAAVATTVALGAVGVIGGSHAVAAAACRVEYTTNAWTDGFTASVKITPGTAVDGWRLTWTFPAGQQITNAWNAKVSQSGAAVNATDAGWNGKLASGGSAEFGFQATWRGSNPAPVDFVLNGAPCGGDGTPTTAPSATPTASPTTSPTAGPGGACGAAVICDGFEDQAGDAPAGRWTVAHPDCSGAGTVTVDNQVARAGARSLRVAGAAGYCNHVFAASTVDLATVGPTWYARFYVRHTTPLPVSHVTFLTMNDAGTGGRDLRMGGQNSALQWNREIDDATLPEQSPAGVALSAPLPVDRWNCVEFEVRADGTIRTWLNGADVPGLVADGTPTRDIDGQWLNRTWRPSLTNFQLGWESYGEGADTLWFDDVVVGRTRAGC